MKENKKNPFKSDGYINWKKAIHLGIKPEFKNYDSTKYIKPIVDNFSIYNGGYCADVARVDSFAINGGRRIRERPSLEMS